MATANPSKTFDEESFNVVEAVLGKLDAVASTLKVVSKVASSPDLKKTLDHLANELFEQVNELETMPAMPIR